MRIAKRLLIVLSAWAFASSLCAQSLVITKNFEAVPYSAVSAQYKNEFGKWEKPLLDDPFPYALIRIGLEGNERDVTTAKQKLGLYMGRMYMPLDRRTDKPNELLFLVPAGAGHVEIQCGDGCKNQVIIDLPLLQSNTIYYGQVHYVPAKEFTPQPVQPRARQFFKFRVAPTNAVVTVWENGTEEIIPMKEGGVASKVFEYGSYQYRISADRYHFEEGVFTVSDTQREMTITLRPKFGYLNVSGDATAQGAYVFATNQRTGGMTQLGTIPFTNKEMDAGVYILRVQKEKYKDYSTTVTIEEGKTTNVRPVLQANFAKVTLTTQAGADILIDGTKLGVGRYTGTLELGEYTIETRQASHKSAYTILTISPQSADKTIALNNPVPIYGSLIVDGTPSDAKVYVNGKYMGLSSLVVNQLLIGEYKVVLEKDGYDKQEKKVQISENQEGLIDYTLIKTVAKAPMLTTLQGVDMEKITVNGVSFNMIKVAGGTFTMGATLEQGSDAYSAERPSHKVTLSDYMIGETEVTQELWRVVMGTYPSSFSGTNLPVEGISWYDCQTFIRKLNQMTGKNFRLPTEAEWEYAARGGQKSKGYKYAGGNTLSVVAWCVDNSSSKTHPVKQKQPNELGIYDMSGNVYEWCQDWFGSYSSGAQTNPRGSSTGAYRVLRGGSWGSHAGYCRVSPRDCKEPTGMNRHLGLRLAL